MEETPEMFSKALNIVDFMYCFFLDSYNNTRQWSGVYSSILCTYI